MAVEKFRIRPFADGMQPQKNVLQLLCGIEIAFLFIKGLVFLLNEVIQFGKNRIVLRSECLEIGCVGNLKGRIHSLKHDFNHIDFPVCKVLVGPEEVL